MKESDGKKAVVLYSGGVDSTTCMALAREAGYIPYAISFAYGQRHSLEMEVAKKNAKAFGAADHLMVEFDYRKVGGSALTSSQVVPKKGIQEGIPVTYVPARNTIFLSFALGWAEVLGAFDVFIGVNGLDYSGYPDCRPEYIAQFEVMANLATKASVDGVGKFRIHTPLITMTKADIIRTGLSLGVDYGRTHSCYDPSPDGIACGECDSCRLRQQGFSEAGIADPAQYNRTT